MDFRPCNVCGETTNLRHLYVRRGFPIIRCLRCGLVYSGRIPPPDALEAVYSSEFFSSDSKFTVSENRAAAANCAARVRDILSLPGVGRDRWLDVGCATGDFLLAAQPAVRQVHGNDISAYAVEVAKRRGLAHVQASDFGDFAAAHGAFDVVTLWDAIEHVPDPARAIAKVYDLLRPGGYLLLTTGDIESRVARITGRFWHLMIPPKHLYFFSRRSLQALLERAGFEGAHVHYTGKRVPLDFLISKSLSLVQPRLGRTAAALLRPFRLERIAPRVNLYDIMTVCARKPDEPPAAGATRGPPPGCAGGGLDRAAAPAQSASAKERA